MSEFFADWLEVFVRPNRSYSTHRQYSQVWRNYLAPSLGNLPLGSLSSIECQKALNALQGRLSPRSVELSRTVLVKALSDAVRQGLVASNPAQPTFRPKVPPPRLRALRPDECRRLAANLGTDVHSAIVLFLLGSGLRISEALGLKWDDLEPGWRAMAVERRLEWLKGGAWRLAPLKTRKSRRRVPVSPLALQALHLAPGGGEFVFCGAQGRPLWPRNIQRSLDAALERAGLPHYSLHDLRRTFATTLARSGTPVHLVQAVMGHESVATTLGHYTSPFEEDVEAAVSQIGPLLVPATEMEDAA